jgi:hypothetical protein
VQLNEACFVSARRARSTAESRKSRPPPLRLSTSLRRWSGTTVAFERVTSLPPITGSSCFAAWTTTASPTNSYPFPILFHPLRNDLGLQLIRKAATHSATLLRTRSNHAPKPTLQIEKVYLPGLINLIQFDSSNRPDAGPVLVKRCSQKNFHLWLEKIKSIRKHRVDCVFLR